MNSQNQCHVCGSKNQETRHDLAEYLSLPSDYKLLRCSDCELCYLDPRPDLHVLGTMYANDAYYSVENGVRGEARREFYSKKISRLGHWVSPPGKMLGLASLDGGHALSAARELGWDVVGVEWSPGMIEYAQERLGIDVRPSVAWDLSIFSENSFDVVYTHSFEHMVDLRRSLQQCRRVLVSGGFMLLEVPNQFDSLKSLLVRNLRRILGNRYAPLPEHDVTSVFHLYYFNITSLKNLFDMEGFELLDTRTYIPYHPAWLRNPRAPWLQNAIYFLGGLFGRGPTIEVVARVIEPKLI